MISVSSSTELALIFREHSKVCVLFKASWCGPCQKFGPLVDELVPSFKDVYFCKVDVDETQQLAIHYKIRSMPTLKLFSHGHEVYSGKGDIEATRAALTTLSG